MFPEFPSLMLYFLVMEQIGLVDLNELITTILLDRISDRQQYFTFVGSFVVSEYHLKEALRFNNLFAEFLDSKSILLQDSG